MTTLHIYLTFNGNCEEAFEFYKSVFGVDYESFSRFNEMPPQEGMPPISDEEANLVMHASLKINEHSVLMGSDTGRQWASHFKEGNNFSISVNVDTKEEADKLFEKLSVDGQITMPMEQTFWESYFGMLTDQFGISWMVGTESKS